MLKKWMFFAIAGFFSQVALANNLPDFTELVEKQGPAVVNISTTQIIHAPQMFQGMPDLPEDDPFYDFFRHFAPQAPHEQESQSLGSGFIISADGYILTNAHVVDHADKITVRLADKRELKAKVIGADKRTDVALLKIEATGLPKVALGSPDQLKVGEWVVAIGSPFGFDSSVTAGIVSAKGRSLPQENFVPFIQTDVAINPGNSGGPLFNMKGEVVGINSQIYSRSGGYMGLSFSIPIDVAMDVVNQLRSTGKVTRGRIGVTIQEVTQALADSFGLSKAGGALISSVDKNGPADKAGVHASDVILKFDGKAINSSADLPRIVAATKPGSKVSVQLWRKGSTMDVSLVVGEIKDAAVVAQHGGARGNAEASSESEARLGLFVSELNDQQKAELQVEGGLIVQDLKGPAARSQLQRGDVILAIGNVEIRSIEQFNEVLKTVPRGRNIALLVRRSEGTVYVPIKLDDK
ncbi:periplasmic pH-dependent serine endoprotease DegQ [Sideroxyarcus emersonii]|uniref:Probable periplasmic serine endoprotease DegP-like n=1 Tax=Sideroxyarcus emersonii TaxID=2764705 RepID=A0AAN1XB77_9PROT|nr:DegQ family serine endoprotease [Sideroxyarcus emersonii]BCK87903.1 periplasmic pH-dependent serine endoprotease DegQ [Sideroxyarcus emersonii]